MEKLTVTGLFVYPVKSLGGFGVSQSAIDKRGLQYDRRWMLADENNVFITQRKSRQLALLQTGIVGGDLIISKKNNPADSIKISLQHQYKESIKVDVWGDICLAQSAEPEINEWFSESLQMKCRLVYMPEDSERKVDVNYAQEGELTAFSDGYPILMLSEESLFDLNSRLSVPVPINRFRPNIVISGASPFQEDDIKKFEINGLQFLGVKPCGRCIVTTIDQDRGTISDEPLKTLSSYRKKDNKVLFGQNVLPKSFGQINVGDEVIITG
jgi:uncharacterized protein YcbX